MHTGNKPSNDIVTLPSSLKCTHASTIKNTTHQNINAVNVTSYFSCAYCTLPADLSAFSIDARVVTLRCELCFPGTKYCEHRSHNSTNNFSERRGNKIRQGEMTTLRQFSCDDLFRFNNVNLDALTETYHIPFYLQYLQSWPDYFVVDEAPGGQIMGYSE
jgi:hypothetical protein